MLKAVAPDVRRIAPMVGADDLPIEQRQSAEMLCGDGCFECLAKEVCRRPTRLDHIMIEAEAVCRRPTEMPLMWALLLRNVRNCSALPFEASSQAQSLAKQPNCGQSQSGDRHKGRSPPRHPTQSFSGANQ